MFEYYKYFLKLLIHVIFMFEYYKYFLKLFITNFQVVMRYIMC